jgi:hypothetical protein
MRLLFWQKYVVLNKRVNEGALNGCVPLEMPATIKGRNGTASVWRDKPRPSGWFPAAAR